MESVAEGTTHLKKVDTFAICFEYEINSSSPARSISSGLSIPSSPLHLIVFPPNSFVRFSNSPVTSKVRIKLPLQAFALKRFLRYVDLPDPISPQTRLL